MKSYKKYYLEKMYPLQDGILQVLSKLPTPFYLTGGTALSRLYYNHRFSDDLDFFVNSDPQFDDYIKLIIEHIKDNSGKSDYSFESDKSVYARDYIQLNIRRQDIFLKLDFVNDISGHTGEINKYDLFPRIDSIMNIFTNKLTALSRYEPKDIVDLWIIWKNTKINWKKAFKIAREKEAGIDPLIISDIIGTFPLKNLNGIYWNMEISKEEFADDIKKMINEILLKK